MSDFRSDLSDDSDSDGSEAGAFRAHTPRSMPSTGSVHSMEGGSRTPSAMGTPPKARRQRPHPRSASSASSPQSRIRELRVAGNSGKMLQEEMRGELLVVGANQITQNCDNLSLDGDSDEARTRSRSFSCMRQLKPVVSPPPSPPRVSRLQSGSQPRRRPSKSRPTRPSSPLCRVGSKESSSPLSQRKFTPYELRTSPMRKAKAEQLRRQTEEEALLARVPPLPIGAFHPSPHSPLSGGQQHPQVFFAEPDRVARWGQGVVHPVATVATVATAAAASESMDDAPEGGADALDFKMPSIGSARATRL